MKHKKLFQKVVFVALIILILFSLVAPAIFSQKPASPYQEKLLNGLKVLMWPSAAADKVQVKIRVHAGSAFDPQEKEGLMQMLADNIFPNEAAREFFSEDLDGGLEVISNYDYIQITASAKPDSLVTMVETLASAVSNPTIDKEQTAKLRAALAARATVLEMDPAYVADQAIAKRLLGTFPYGRPENGSSSSLLKIDFADLVDAKNRFLTADNATIAVSGNFDRDLAYRAIRRYFGSWLKADKKVPPTFREPDEVVPALLTVISPKPDSAAARVAVRGVAQNSPDFAASMVFASILEARLKSRIAAEFAASLFVQNNVHALPGSLVIGFALGKGDAGPEHGKMDVREIVAKAIADPVSEAEFQSAKAIFKSQWSKRDTPSFWLDIDTYRLSGLDAYMKSAETVTLNSVSAYAEKLRKLPLAAIMLSNPPTK